MRRPFSLAHHRELYKKGHAVEHDNQNTAEDRLIMFEWLAALVVVVVYSRVMTVHAARLCEPAPTRSLGDGEE